MPAEEAFRDPRFATGNNSGSLTTTPGGIAWPALLVIDPASNTAFGAGSSAGKVE